jgi:hypothetical protein
VYGGCGFGQESVLDVLSTAFTIYVFIVIEQSCREQNDLRDAGLSRCENVLT